MRSKYMICPAVNLGSSAFAPVDCQLNPVFLWRDFVLPSAITDQVFRFVRQLCVFDRRLRRSAFLRC